MGGSRSFRQNDATGGQYYNNTNHFCGLPQEIPSPRLKMAPELARAVFLTEGLVFPGEDQLKWLVLYLLTSVLTKSHQIRVEQFSSITVTLL